jgi:integrase
MAEVRLRQLAQARFRPAAGAAGLVEWDARRTRWFGDFTPYDLRHTSASLMIAAGRPIAEVADHLGRVDVCARTYATRSRR